MEMFSNTKTTWYVSGIKKNRLRHQSSLDQFKTLASARKYIASEEAKTYARNNEIIEYRISRIIEIADDDIESHKLPIEVFSQ